MLGVVIWDLKGTERQLHVEIEKNKYLINPCLPALQTQWCNQGGLIFTLTLVFAHFVIITHNGLPQRTLPPLQDSYTKVPLFSSQGGLTLPNCE